MSDTMRAFIPGTGALKRERSLKKKNPNVRDLKSPETWLTNNMSIISIEYTPVTQTILCMILFNVGGRHTTLTFTGSSVSAHLVLQYGKMPESTCGYSAISVKLYTVIRYKSCKILAGSHLMFIQRFDNGGIIKCRLYTNFFLFLLWSKQLANMELFEDSADAEPFFCFNVENINLLSSSLVVMCTREITVLTWASPSMFVLSNSVYMTCEQGIETKNNNWSTNIICAWLTFLWMDYWVSMQTQGRKTLVLKSVISVYFALYFIKFNALIVKILPV